MRTSSEVVLIAWRSKAYLAGHAVGKIRAVDDDEIHLAASRLLQSRQKPSVRRGHDGHAVVVAPVRPLGGGRLLVEVYDRDAVAGAGGGDGEMDGEGGLPCPALLAHDGDGLHVDTSSG